MLESLKSRLLFHDRQAPRYTSYPPATQFANAFHSETVSGWISSIPAGEAVSLYVHIPFCAQLCYYCGCHTSVVHNLDRVAAYLNILEQEIKLVASRHGARLPVSHLHFGGGSPTLLTDELFNQLMNTLHRHFDFSAVREVAIEADPRNLTESKIRTYAAAGVNRLSLGVQDFDQEVLRRVNRPQPAELTIKAINWARAAGINSINFDLMYGLPGQTVESQRQTMAQAIALKPDRIAWFGYAHVPWMKKHMNVVDTVAMPDASQRYDMFMAGQEMLLAAGYRSIGIDHFVLPHDEMYLAYAGRQLHRNFQGYTTDTARHLIAFGASAISAHPQGFSQNTIDQRQYADSIAAGQLPVSRGLVMLADDVVRARVIEEIMCYFRVDLDSIIADFALPADYFNADKLRLAALVRDNLVSLEGSRLTVDPEARQAARMVAMAFDSYAVEALPLQRHSRAI